MNTSPYFITFLSTFLSLLSLKIKIILKIKIQDCPGEIPAVGMPNYNWNFEKKLYWNFEANNIKRHNFFFKNLTWFILQIILFCIVVNKEIIYVFIRKFGLDLRLDLEQGKPHHIILIKFSLILFWIFLNKLHRNVFKLTSSPYSPWKLWCPSGGRFLNFFF